MSLRYLSEFLSKSYFLVYRRYITPDPIFCSPRGRYGILINTVCDPESPKRGILGDAELPYCIPGIYWIQQSVLHWQFINGYLDQPKQIRLCKV